MPRRNASSTSNRAAFSRFRPLRVEPLEDRRLLTVFTVTNLLDAGAGSLRQAVLDANAAPGGDEVRFDTSLTGSLSLVGGQIEVNEWLTIVGPGADRLTIDAQGQSRIFHLDVLPAAIDLTLTDMRLTGGDADSGGAVQFRSEGTLTLERMDLSGNFGERGGAVSVVGNLNISHSTLSRNGAGDSGGAISASGAVTIADSILAHNRAGSQVGGAISASSRDLETPLRLERSTFSGNTAFRDGGAVYALSNVAVTDSTITGNWTTGIEGDGGGVLSRRGITLVRSTVANNRTEESSADGGGMRAYDDITIIDSILSGNRTMSRASRGGGAMTLRGAVFITGSTISDNTTAGESSDGGGVWAGRGAAIHTSTIVNNHTTHATANGGGIYVSPSFLEIPSPTTITNSIVAGNTALGDAPDVHPGEGELTVRFSLIGDGSGMGLAEAPLGAPDADGALIGGPVNGAIDPLLGPLADNGGPTMTHALLAGSPAIDAGDPNFTPPPEFDQRGAPFVRVFDGRVDMGAIEHQDTTIPSIVVDTLVDELDDDHGPGDLSLREALALANERSGFDTITFADGLSGRIQLTLGELTISDSVALSGASPLFVSDRFIIDAGGQSRIVSITEMARDVLISDLSFFNGRTAGDNFGLSDHTHSGGAIRASQIGKLTLERVSVFESSTTGVAAAGGGVFLGAAGGEIIDSTIFNNSTQGGDNAHGGGVFSLGPLTLRKSTISRNSAAGDGGGVYAGLDSSLLHATITDNRAAWAGALAFARSRNPILVRDSILAGNHDATGPRDVAQRPSLAYSLIGFGWTGALEAPVGAPDVDGNLIGGPVNGVIDPLLGPLADNGGPTMTHALLAGSPAIDAGDPNFTSPPEFDQRGAPFARVVGGRIDMGAFEVPPPPVWMLGDTNGDFVIDLVDLNNVRNNFGAQGNPDGSLTGDTFPFDGVVDLNDLTLLRNVFGARGTPPPPAPAATPIPAPSASNFASHSISTNSLTFETPKAPVMSHPSTGDKTSAGPIGGSSVMSSEIDAPPRVVAPRMKTVDQPVSMPDLPIAKIAPRRIGVPQASAAQAAERGPTRLSSLAVDAVFGRAIVERGGEVRQESGLRRRGSRGHVVDQAQTPVWSRALSDVLDELRVKTGR